jgi:DinB family protein
VPEPTRPPTGRPQTGEFADYARTDIDQVEGDDAVEALATQERTTLELLDPLTEAQVSGLRYAPGKWTLKEVIGHLADDERIYCYRALCVARGEPLPLPGFDENLYVAEANFEARPLADLLKEYRSVREATITLLSGLPREAWDRKGQVNGYTESVRGLAFHIAGHELRHVRALREKYLRLIT